MAALKLERHGAGWRYTKRVPKALQAPTPSRHTASPRRSLTRRRLVRWLADLEEEFQRLRLTGNKFKQAIAPDEIAHLVALMVHSSLNADEESREAGDYADDEDYAAALGRLDRSRLKHVRHYPSVPTAAACRQLLRTGCEGSSTPQPDSLTAWCC